VRRGGLTVGPHAFLESTQPLDRRHQRHRPACQHHGPARLELLVTHDDATFVGEAAVAAEQRDPVVLHPTELCRIVGCADDLVAAPQDRADVEVAVGGLSSAGDPSCLGQRLMGPQERL
jgi:hypothetical protein